MSERNLEDNTSRQAEEVEALSAIYGDDFIIVDEQSNIYEILIKPDINLEWPTSLRFVLPPGYPCEDCPEYEVQCYLFSRDDEMKIIQEFQKISEENVGECFIFQWAEKLREIVEKKACDVQERQAHCPLQQQESASNSEELLVESLLDVVNEVSIQDNTILHDKTQGYDQPQFEIAHGEPFTDRKSTFQAHLAVVTSRGEVDQVLFQLKLNRKVANASHNIMAYRIFNADNNSYIQDCDDDGENAAGSRLLHLLQITDVKNVVIVVTRWYGGLLLGPDRFKHINNCARNILESCGFVEGKKSSENKESKGKRTAKLKKHK